MIKKLQTTILALALIVTGTLAMSTAAYAAPAAGGACGGRFLTFPNWYDGLTAADCTIQAPAGDPTKLVWTIVGNVVEIILQVVAYVSTGYIIYGGFRYIISQGTSEGMAKAKKTILNAVIGLVIAIFSVAIVNLISGAMG